jgi:uncharacterized surface protein with fasciclin (FAS1) repeats
LNLRLINVRIRPPSSTLLTPRSSVDAQETLMPINPTRSALVRAMAAAALALTVAAPVAAQTAKDFVECRVTAAVDFPGTIVDAAMMTPTLSTLTSLVVSAGLAGALSAPGDLTVYAPTNDAFTKIPPAVLGAIGGDLGVLTAVLTYHVVPGPGDPRVLGVRQAASLQGQTLYIGYDKTAGNPRINQSKADCTAVKTTNGTVWIIDSVLLPQFR